MPRKRSIYKNEKNIPIQHADNREPSLVANKSKREVIALHIGQAGIQMGNATWELFALEHGVSQNGFIPEDLKVQQTDGFSAFFKETGFGNCYPLAVFIDLEPSVIDTVRNGPLKGLYNPENFLSGKEDAANNYARGYYTVGTEFVEESLERVRKVSEECDSLQGFVVYQSLGGGTGSGYGALLLKEITDLLPKQSKLDFTVFPSPVVSCSVVEPYNAILATHATLDTVECEFIADNEALYDICKKQLEVERPSFQNLNRLLAQTVSSVTASLRFDGPLNVDIIEFQTNLVPYPRIHFPLLAYAPFINSRKLLLENISVEEITKSCFEPGHQMIKCNLSQGQFMACCLLYRGDVIPKEINEAILALKEKRNTHFVDWSPTGFKTGINYRPPSSVPDSDLPAVPRALCSISNTTAIREAWLKQLCKYETMFKRKCFVHWYVGEGMDISEMTEAKEDVATLCDDYENIALQSEIQDL